MLGAGVLGMGTLAPHVALADHTLEDPITDMTAYTLHDDEWRVGLWKVEYGVTDTISVGTYTLPLAAYLLPVPFTVGSATAKWSFWQSQQKDNQLAGGVRLGFYSVGFAERSDLRMNIIPVELVGSYRRHVGMSLHGGLIFTKVSISGGSPDGDSLNGGAAGT